MIQVLYILARLFESRAAQFLDHESWSVVKLHDENESIVPLQVRAIRVSSLRAPRWLIVPNDCSVLTRIQVIACHYIRDTSRHIIPCMVKTLHRPLKRSACCRGSNLCPCERRGNWWWIHENDDRFWRFLQHSMEKQTFWQMTGRL